jgi:hypothetical protein
MVPRVNPRRAASAAARSASFRSLRAAAPVKKGHVESVDAIAEAPRHPRAPGLVKEDHPQVRRNRDGRVDGTAHRDQQEQQHDGERRPVDVYTRSENSYASQLQPLSRHRVDRYLPISGASWNATLVKLCAMRGNSRLPVLKRSQP